MLYICFLDLWLNLWVVVVLWFLFVRFVLGLGVHIHWLQLTSIQEVSLKSFTFIWRKKHLLCFTFCFWKIFCCFLIWIVIYIVCFYWFWSNIILNIRSWAPSRAGLRSSLRPICGKRLSLLARLSFDLYLYDFNHMWLPICKKRAPHPYS